MKMRSEINSFGDTFTVSTSTRLFMLSKPHSSVIPFMMDGSWTSERGFQVYYSTSDATILEEFHQRLCDEVEAGGYRAMVDSVRDNQPPIRDAHLVKYITGFKY